MLEPAMMRRLHILRKNRWTRLNKLLPKFDLATNMQLDGNMPFLRSLDRISCFEYTRKSSSVVRGGKFTVNWLSMNSVGFSTSRLVFTLKVIWESVVVFGISSDDIALLQGLLELVGVAMIVLILLIFIFESSFRASLNSSLSRWQSNAIEWLLIEFGISCSVAL